MGENPYEWRVNREGMERCCYHALQYEMYRRKEANEPLMKDGDTLTCSTCNGEMICDPSLVNQRLRWRWKGEAV